jgi:hypothetical protein
VFELIISPRFSVPRDTGQDAGQDGPAGHYTTVDKTVNNFAKTSVEEIR